MSAAKAPGFKSTSNVTCHAVVADGQRYLRNMLAVKSDWPGFSLRTLARKLVCTGHERQPQRSAEHSSITHVLGASLPAAALSRRNGFVFILILIFFF